MKGSACGLIVRLAIQAMAVREPRKPTRRKAYRPFRLRLYSGLRQSGGAFGAAGYHIHSTALRTGYEAVCLSKTGVDAKAEALAYLEAEAVRRRRQCGGGRQAKAK